MCAAVSRCIAIACVAALVACQERLDSQERTASMHGTLTLAQRHSGYAGNREDWSGFLACWYQAAVVRHQEERRRDSNTPYTPILAKYARGAHMQRPVEGMPQAIQRLETSLGVSLPRSYKDFLLAYEPSGFEPYIVNGVSFKVGMYSPAEVDRYAKLEPEMVAEQGKWPIHSADAEYFTYGVKQDDASGRTEYHHDAIVVGKHGNSQYEVIVLYPQVRTADGEMEAALFYHSGEFRAPSFAEVMRQLSILETQPVDHVPPYPQSMLHGTCAEKLPIKDVWWE